MGYFQVRYDSRVVNYERRGFIRLATEADVNTNLWVKHSDWLGEVTWLVTSNQRALFQRGIDTLLWNLCVTLAPQDPGFESNHWQLSLNIKWIKKAGSVRPFLTYSLSLSLSLKIVQILNRLTAKILLLWPLANLQPRYTWSTSSICSK